MYDPIADSISTIANIPRATGETRALTFAPLGGTDYEMWVMGGGRDAPNPSSEVDTYEVFFHPGWSTFGSFLTPRRNFAIDGTFRVSSTWQADMLVMGYTAELDGILLLPRSHANSNSNSYSYTFTYGYTNADTYAPNADGNCDSDSHTDCNADSNCNSLSKSDTNAKRDDSTGKGDANPTRSTHSSAAPVAFPMKKKRTAQSTCKERFMKNQINPTVRAHLIRGASFLFLISAVGGISLALAQRQIGGLTTKEKPTGAVCFPPSWTAGPDMPSTGVRMVGVYFPANGKFYTMGGRSMDGVGNDFTHPFEYDPVSNIGLSSRPAYPDNQVSNMACGVMTDSGTDYIYCIGGSAAWTDDGY